MNSERLVVPVFATMTLIYLHFHLPSSNCRSCFDCSHCRRFVRMLSPSNTLEPLATIQSATIARSAHQCLANCTFNLNISSVFVCSIRAFRFEHLPEMCYLSPRIRVGVLQMDHRHGVLVLDFAILQRDVKVAEGHMVVDDERWREIFTALFDPIFNKIRSHDNHPRVLFPYHAPKVDHCRF